MTKKKDLVIVGEGEFAEIACEYFSHDSDYEVVAFAAERQYLTKQTLFERPVVALEDIQDLYPPDRFDVFVAVTFTQLNRVRARLFHEVKQKGYHAASFVSPHAFVWKNVKIGENCFIFENNVIQYCVEIGDNVILWSGNHVGHRTVIREHAFISSHAVISGYCDIGESCFIGVNSTFADNLKIGKDGVIGAGAVVVKPTETGKVYVGNPARMAGRDSYESFKVPESVR